MSDFLLELLSEEIPARMQAKAKEDLARLFGDALAKAGLQAAALETFATPRRLALIARGLPDATDPVREETKGPKIGAPQAAIDGFLRKTGLSQDQLVKRGGVYFAQVERGGRASADVLAEAIPPIIRAFPWPKSQRWGASSLSSDALRWVRPLQGIVALLGDRVVPVAIEDIVSGRTTMGHRFHSDGPVSIANPGAYVEALRAAHVIVHFSERCQIIRDGAARVAAAAGLTVIADEALVAENAGLTEWPVPLLGRFDADYLTVPPEVIQLTARVNQKYFVCADATGALSNAFVCTANIMAADGGAAIIAGNQKVLAARLADAKFFWEQDLKIPLDQQAEKLSHITFHEKLGTLADKVERVANLARWLAEEGIVPGCDPVLAERAARLAKADLVTGMVGEFPELQGVMGGYYARAQGEGDAIADAIRDHYKPVGQGDAVPSAPVTVAVSLADKLDTIAGFFSENEKPTGSKDPFALRRAALGVLAMIFANKLRIDLRDALLEATWRQPFGRQLDPTLLANRTFGELARFIRMGRDVAVDLYRQLRAQADDRAVELAEQNTKKLYHIVDEAMNFFADRLKVQQREAGVRHDLIDAVFALGGEDDLVRLLTRVHALQAFIDTADGANLLAGYKRAANLLKNADGADGVAAGTAPTAADAALLGALDVAEPLALAAVRDERFADAMHALAGLRAPIDAFFTDVMVNDPDPAVRAFRLKLLARFRDACHAVADFSKIEA
ncbi:MAG: glycine--tRNA ligase subunit beta [Sphingomonadaceae bacterium]|nr:glycine--tRNA ligase subunit beta [Sphingomonadaceae bacterium]